MTSPETRKAKACTCCFHPTVVNLSNDNCESNHLSSPELQRNLQQYGWSLIRYNGGNPSTTTTWKEERLVPLFRCQESFQSSQYSFRFRTNESGGCRQELKQSWEIAFRSDDEEKEETSDDTANPLQKQIQHDMVDWFQLFHKIATAVCRHLQLPCNTLLEEGSDSRRLDLLRVFYYETAGENNTSENDDDDDDEEEVTLGSSPHTDWGSFTVVWQDSVGGLQTYCRSCQRWTDVAPMPDTFIVHCSDVTSLALQKKWPSPTHRVVSPKNERRVSLVYFAYPPRHLSLKDISEQLSSSSAAFQRQDQNQQQAAEDGVLIDNDKDDDNSYENYSLLQNQSVNADSQRGAKQQFEQIYNLPLQQVIQDKWQQVQRY